MAPLIRTTPRNLALGRLLLLGTLSFALSGLALRSALCFLILVKGPRGVVFQDTTASLAGVDSLVRARRQLVEKRKVQATTTEGAAEVQRLVAEHDIIVFSKTYCPFCSQAKDALTNVGAEFVALELDERVDGDDIQNALAEETGGRSVPRVFIGGKFIGGGDDTVDLYNSGDLASMVEAIQAK